MSDALRIEFERSGGFAGVRLTAAVDTAALPDEERRGWGDLVARAESEPAAAPGEGAGRDRFTYRVAITDERGTRELALHEAGLTAPQRQLVARLLDVARRR